MSSHLLIIEDDAGLSQMLAFHFEDQGYTVSQAADCARARACVKNKATDLILLDQHLPDGKGLELLPSLLTEDKELPVIMMTGFHNLDLAIQAIKQGAFDFIHKPIKIDELNHVVRKALESRRLSRELAVLKSEPRYPTSTGDFIGSSDAMLQISKEIALTAESDARVLITGESGTGKEVVARLIHSHSRKKGPFVAINCAAIVDTLLESELFGHEKGAFTGANARKLGKFELARDGTLFLDEIGELAQPLQAKLLRVLQENVLVRVGGNQEITTNARIIAATNRDLDIEVEQKRFREDLKYRLGVVTISLPPLRERSEDIPALADVLMKKISDSIHKPVLRISDKVLDLLRHYAWPGNIRELENILTQAMVHARNDVLTPDLLPPAIASAGFIPAGKHRSDQDPLQSLEAVEAEHIQRVLNRLDGHKGKSCQVLGISRPALDRKIKKYALTLPDRD